MTTLKCRRARRPTRSRAGGGINCHGSPGLQPHASPPATAAFPGPSSMPRFLTALSGLLILYGSLYPFEFAAPDAVAWQLFWQDTRLWSSRGDVLGNVALFVPWAAFCTAALRHRRPPMQSMLLALTSGLVLALIAQVGQLMVPSRAPAMSDVLWNAVGCALGLPIGHWLARRHHRPGERRGNDVAMLLLVGCVVVAWLPLVPSLDWAWVKSQLRTLTGPPVWHGGALAEQAALTLLAGWALAHWLRGLPLLLAHASLVGLLLLGRLFVVQAQLDVNVVSGSAVGALLWWSMAAVPQRPGQRDRALAPWLALLLLYTVGALWPFALRDSPTPMSWQPVNSLLQGNMLDNSRALLGALVLFAGMLAAARAAGARLLGSALSLALWVLTVEGLQCWIDTRSGDITAVLLVLLAGAGVAWLDDDRRPAALPLRPTGDAADARQMASPVTTTLWHPAWSAIALVGVIVTAISVVLRLPGVPYNVLELFRADGHPALLAVFALALLWLGFGPGWLGRRLARARWAVLWLPLGALGCALVALMLLAASVTEESLGDIAGSTNLVWFVTNRDLWGSAWRQIFLAVDMPEAISFLERCARWAALYGPLPLVLATGVALAERRHAATVHTGLWTTGLLLSGGLTLWLCKAIAFDWSSTDNLNELIAPDGPWGWGGGVWLYALLLLIGANAWALARGLKRGAPAVALGLLASALALPLGWWLLNQGLDPAVEKYGNVFSGAQFLLGPDRRHLLPPDVLMWRWFVVQAGAVALISAGLWLDQRVARWRSMRALQAR